MSSIKSTIAASVQYCLEHDNWQAAIEQMENLFAISQDPLIRVRIGDASRKLGREADAVKEYVYAADLFEERGFIIKAQALYTLALRLDATNTYARSKLEKLSTCRIYTNLRPEPREYIIPQPAENAFPIRAFPDS